MLTVLRTQSCNEFDYIFCLQQLIWNVREIVNVGFPEQAEIELYNVWLIHYCFR